MKFAKDIIDEIEKRGRIDMTENDVTGEAFEEWLYKEDKMNDMMIIASNKAELTREELLDKLFNEGVLAVYNLGMKHMYEYLEGEH